MVRTININIDTSIQNPAELDLVSLNEIFLATGDIEFKAVIPKSDKSNILFTRMELEDLILELCGKRTRIEYL